jgi:dTMP kinase
MPSGFFITFEGGEGCGKSTQARLLAEFLKQREYSAILTREPGGSSIAETIRPLFFDPHLSEESRFFLVWAARCDHLKKIIEPALAKGDWIVCDRFCDSTWAYQGAGYGLDCQTLETIEQQFVSVQPHLTFFLDLPPQSALHRAQNRPDPSSYTFFEHLPMAYHERVYQGFLRRCQTFPKRIRAIPAETTIESVHSQVIQCLQTEGFLN